MLYYGSKRKFKKLKELRLERKLKSKELNCLYTLTDYIDCVALAKTCEANLEEVENIMSDEKENIKPAQIQAVENDEEVKEDLEDGEDMVG